MDETAENFISIDDYIHLFCSEFFSYPKGVVFCLAMPINWNTLQNLSNENVNYIINFLLSKASITTSKLRGLIGSRLKATPEKTPRICS